MQNNPENRTVKQKTFPAYVAKVIDDCKLVINKGAIDDIRQDQRMLVYSLDGEEVKDPNTGESLGFLEVYKGTGKVIQVMEKMSIIESDRINHLFKGTVPKSPLPKQIFNQYYSRLLPFREPQVGDLVKPI